MSSIRRRFEHLFAAFCSIAARPEAEDIAHDKLADQYELIFRVLGRSINDKEIKVSSRARGIDSLNGEEQRPGRSFVRN